MGHDVDALSAAFAGRYRIEREIGSGGMATVYLAHDIRQDRDVAIKVMAPDVAAGFGVERFAREVAIAGRLAHPNIVPVFDSGTISLGDATLPFYVMPFVPGESLRARLHRERQLPLDDALGIVRDIAEALDTAHAQGVVHRDVKPENILLVAGRAMLADFGVARAVQAPQADAGRLTSTGIAVGTPAYMSPEQSAGDPVVDGRADTYALAVTAYEMLAGETPFTGVTPQAVLARQLSGDVHPLATIRPHVVTASMDESIARALSPAPADRFASTGAFVAALAAGRTRETTASETGGRRRSLAMAGVAAAVVIVAVLALRDTWSGGARGADGRLGVGVMPFRALATASEWSETLPDLLSTFLDGTPGVRVADPWALWRPLRPTSDAPARSPDPREAERLARRAGVTRYVMGAVVRSGERLDLTLRIYGVGISDPVSTFTMNGSVDSSAQLAQRTAVEVLERVWEREGGPAVPRMESLFTQSPDALKAYLAAREAMRRGMPDSANSAITRAITIDSAFALGMVEAVMIRSWVQSMSGQTFSGLRDLGQRALANADSLTERQRLRLEATLASIETEGAGAASAWRRLLERDSTDMEASLGLSYATLAYGWQFGATLDDLRRSTEHAVRLDSTDVRALVQRATAAMARWDPDDLQRQAGRLRALRTEAPLGRATLLGIELVLAPDAVFAARVDTLTAMPALQWVVVFRTLRAYRPDRARQLAERTVQHAMPGPVLNFAVGGLTGILLAAGDARGADSVAAASPGLASMPGAQRHAQRTIAAALLGVEDTAATARAVRLLSAHVPLDSALAYFDERPVWSVSWSLGTWHAQRGDTALARQWAAMLSRFRPGGAPAMWRESLAADIASRLADRRGDLDSARVLAARALELWSIHTENITDADPEPALRFRHARFLFEAGMKDSAARILRSFIPPTSWIGSYVPHAHLLLGRIAEERGEREVAARHYDEALQLLALGIDPGSPLRAAAESGARRLVGVSLYRYGREP